MRYFREIVPGIYDELLDQLPSLAPQKALVLGESVKAPSLIEIRKAHPRPKSRNPGFMQHWTDEDSKYPDFENICKRWEGTAQEEQLSAADAGKMQADAKPATSTIDDLDSIFASEDEIPF